jgi:hypothetical protein
MNREKNIETMLTIVTGCLALFLVFKINLILIIGLWMGLIGLFMAGLSRRIAWLWYKIAEGLGYVLSKVLLGLVFYFFLFPIALISRLFRPNVLNLLRKKEGSYFFVRDYIFQSKDLKNPW